MKKQDYQKLSNKICLHFGMNPIPIIFYKRKGRRYGFYSQDKISLNTYNHRLNIDTLLHELAHYLHDYRFNAQIKGYYKMEMWPSMQPCKDKVGWFSATGPLEPVYFISSSHGKAFKQCYDNMLGHYRKGT